MAHDESFLTFTFVALLVEAPYLQAQRKRRSVWGAGAGGGATGGLILDKWRHCIYTSVIYSRGPQPLERGMVQICWSLLTSYKYKQQQKTIKNKKK